MGCFKSYGMIFFLFQFSSFFEETVGKLNVQRPVIEDVVWHEYWNAKATTCIRSKPHQIIIGVISRVCLKTQFLALKFLSTKMKSVHISLALWKPLSTLTAGIFRLIWLILPFDTRQTRGIFILHKDQQIIVPGKHGLRNQFSSPGPYNTAGLCRLMFIFKSSAIGIKTQPEKWD